MGTDTRKIRNNSREISEVNKANRVKGKEIEVKATELVSDKGELDKLEKIIESSGLPTDVRQKALAGIAKQQRQLENTFQKDVEIPQEKLDEESKKLANEAADLGRSADKNRQKIEGFNKQSNMDDSPLKQAAKEQAESKVFFENEQRAIADLMREQQQRKEEAKRKVQKVS